MYHMDKSKDDFRGERIESYFDLREDENKIYLEGNSKLLYDFLTMKFEKEEPRVAFFGDQYISDIHYANQLPGWDTIAVIEELSMVR